MAREPLDAIIPDRLRSGFHLTDHAGLDTQPETNFGGMDVAALLPEA